MASIPVESSYALLFSGPCSSSTWPMVLLLRWCTCGSHMRFIAQQQWDMVVCNLYAICHHGAQVATTTGSAGDQRHAAAVTPTNHSLPRMRRHPGGIAELHCHRAPVCSAIYFDVLHEVHMQSTVQGVPQASDLHTRCVMQLIGVMPASASNVHIPCMTLTAV